jgi:hypothetical protein
MLTSALSLFAILLLWAAFTLADRHADAVYSFSKVPPVVGLTLTGLGLLAYTHADKLGMETYFSHLPEKATVARTDTTHTRHARVPQPTAAGQQTPDSTAQRPPSASSLRETVEVQVVFSPSPYLLKHQSWARGRSPAELLESRVDCGDETYIFALSGGSREGYAEIVEGEAACSQALDDVARRVRRSAVVTIGSDPQHPVALIDSMRAVQRRHEGAVLFDFREIGVLGPPATKGDYPDLKTSGSLPVAPRAGLARQDTGDPHGQAPSASSLQGADAINVFYVPSPHLVAQQAWAQGRSVIELLQEKIDCSAEGLFLFALSEGKESYVEETAGPVSCARVLRHVARRIGRSSAHSIGSASEYPADLVKAIREAQRRADGAALLEFREIGVRDIPPVKTRQPDLDLDDWLPPAQTSALTPATPDNDGGPAARRAGFLAPLRALAEIGHHLFAVLAANGRAGIMQESAPDPSPEVTSPEVESEEPPFGITISDIVMQRQAAVSLLLLAVLIPLTGWLIFVLFVRVWLGWPLRRCIPQSLLGRDTGGAPHGKEKEGTAKGRRSPVENEKVQQRRQDAPSRVPGECVAPSRNAPALDATA